MQVREALANDALAIFELLSSNGWAHRIGKLPDFEALLAASQRSSVAVVEGQVVGFARAVTDGVSNGYLSMVVVSSEHRMQGIGKALVETIVGSNPKITWVLRAGREGAPEFFAKLGFVESQTAMERIRSK